MLEILAGIIVAFLVVTPLLVGLAGVMLLAAGATVGIGWTGRSSAHVDLTCPATHHRETVEVQGPNAAGPAWRVKACSGCATQGKAVCTSCRVMDSMGWGDLADLLPASRLVAH